MTSYAQALQAFYDGEVLGEAYYGALAHAAAEPDQRRKWATLTQLETETKAWLRVPMMAAGMGIGESEAERTRGLGLAERMKTLPWAVTVKGLLDALDGQIVPVFRGYADAARARGAADEAAVCDFMIDHELAQVEFARRELAGDEDSLAPVIAMLKYPLG